MTDRTHPDSGRIITSSDILLHDAETALMYEELRAAIDDGHESMTHADALAEVAAMRAENIKLRAQLEAIGAGGVSGPLMGIAAPPIVQALECGAEPPGIQALMCVISSLRDIAHFSDEEGGELMSALCALRDWAHAQTVAALQPTPTAQAEGWTKLPWQLPEPGMPVLLDIGKKYPIRAMWAAKHTVQAADDDTDWAEYDEATETYYCPEGWYEWNEHEEIHWAVTETPRAWMPIPPTSAEGVEHG